MTDDDRIKGWAAGRRRRAAQVRKMEADGCPRVSVVAQPVGPKCTVLTDDGRIIHGHRVPTDYPGCQSVVVTHGFCVEAVAVDGKFRTVLETPAGREKIVNGESGSIKGALSRADTIKTRIRAAVPPELT